MKSILSSLTTISICLSPLAAIAEEKSPSWLFVQTASGFQVEGNVLTLPYEREIFGFTDRPNRLHMHINAHEMVGLWASGDDSFGEDPPNAVLTWVEEGEVHEAEIELISASVNATGRAILYRFAEVGAGELPNTASQVSLFVDDLIDKNIFCNAADEQVKEGVEDADLGAAVGEPPSPTSLVDMGVGLISSAVAGCP